ncbi:ATP-binding protein [Methylocystis heyeri]|uniref:histidine kinase n=1 Tax=Methylocystis heyeri TaxID=391905 RepID=A0A6B8KDF3_9HYPH|nr:ATP-binding protein [Methylocystis heyeri]QGM45729.1 response regulator [Methylocystis heyeri]
MLSTLSQWLFNTAGLEPHGYCLLWEPGLIWLYAASDTMIALAYFSIPLSLAIIGKHRGDLVFRPLLGLFAAFILLCGTSHWLDLLTLWTPLYSLLGLIKAATAITSVITAYALWRGLPNFLALPSFEQLRRANVALRASEERLAHAQKLEAIGQLTGGIAHDFNNVLQVISGSLSVIERKLAQNRDADIAPSLEAIKRASNTATNLVARMLAFSRRQTLAPREIEPDRLVAGMEEMLRRTLGPEIRLDLRPLRCRSNVTCDPSQLESALLNLAINARDAMPQGGTLRISTADRNPPADIADSDVPPGDYVEIEVEDNGAGMSREVLDRAFEPYFTTKPVGRGTGLGLSQIYGFVRQSGGLMRIESEPGKGTSVRIYLPGHAPTACLQAGSAPPSAESFDHCGSRARGKALVVEDQPEVRSQVVDALQEMGYAVCEAPDGITGLKMLEAAGELNLLVSDVGLPGMSGGQLAEIAHAARPALPILLITGYAGASLEKLEIAPNMDVLRKPFTLDQFSASVRALTQAKASVG